MDQIGSKITYNSRFKDLGFLTDLDKREVTKCMNIDSRFRDNYFTSSSSNFTITLPTTLKDVTQIEIKHFELPPCWYAISSKLGNNFFWIRYNHNNKVHKLRFTIPDGRYNCYTLNSILCNLTPDMFYIDGSLQSTSTLSNNPLLNFLLINCLRTADGTGNGKTQIINLTGLLKSEHEQNSACTLLNQKTRLGTGGHEELPLNHTNHPSEQFSQNPHQNPHSSTPIPATTIYLHFNFDSNGNIDANPLPLKLGWMLGFRFGEYTIKQFETPQAPHTGSDHLPQMEYFCASVKQLIPSFTVEVGSNDNLPNVPSHGNPPPAQHPDCTYNFPRQIPLRFSFQDITRYLIYNENFFNHQQNTLVSEAMADIYGPRYIYLAIDDFNNNSITDFYACLNSSVINKKIMLKYASYSQTDDTNTNGQLYNTIFVPYVREFSGPVEINKLNIQLLDEYGRNLELNNMDYSLVLSFKTLFMR